MPYRKSRCVQINLVIGKHEAHAFVFQQCLAKCMALPGVIRGNVVCALSCSKPTHAVAQTCRRKPRLCVLETFPDTPEHIGVTHSEALKPKHSVATNEAGIHGIQHSFHRYTVGMHVGQEHRCAAVLHARENNSKASALGPCNKPLAPTD